MPGKGIRGNTLRIQTGPSVVTQAAVEDTDLGDSYFQSSIRQQPTRLSNIDEEPNLCPDGTINNITFELEDDSDNSSWDEMPTPRAETEASPSISPQPEAIQKSPTTRPPPTEEDYSSFYKAIVDGNLKAVKDKLASPLRLCLARERGDGFTPLVLAIFGGHVTIARMLLKRGADAQQRVRTLRPLVHAVMKKQRAPQFIQLLLDHGANPNFVSGFAQMNALQWAAKEGMVDAADFLISQGMDLNAQCFKGKKPLILAAEKGHLLVVKLLLAQGAELLQKSHSGGTALTWAAGNGHLDIVKHLIAEGIDVDNADKNGLTALAIASNFGHLEVVEYLVTKGADVNCPSTIPKHVTPLMTATVGGHAKVVEALIRHNADLAIRNGNDESVLEVAILKRHIDTVKVLLKAIGGPEHPQQSVALEMVMANSRDTIKALISTASMMYSFFKTKESGEFAWLDWVLESGGQLVKSRAMFHMLHSALYNDQHGLVKALLERGCDPNQHLASGHTPLSSAILHSDLELVQVLLDAGADPAKPAHDPEGLNLTPLHQALGALEADREKDTSIIDALLESGRCKVLEGKRFRSTAFAYALQNFDLWDSSLAEILAFRMLKHISDVNSDRCGDGSTLLHVAVYYSHRDLIGILLEKGADINATNNLGQTPFLLKCQCLPDIIPYLLEHGADPFAKDKEGHSGLHMAADAGKIATLELLLEKGLSLTALTSDGDTPLICALTVGHEDTALYLLDNGADHRIKCMVYLRTILHYAADLSMEKIVERVLQFGDVDVNAKDANGMTALGLACKRGSTNIVKTLIAAGADMESIEVANDRPLHMALINRNEDLAIHLIEQGVDIHATGSYDRTPLHLAAAYGNPRAAELILDRDSTTEALDDQSRTPLGDCGNPTIVQLLIDHGANANAADKDGWTPLHHAVAACNLEVFRLLLKGGADPYTRTDRDGMNVNERLDFMTNEELRWKFEDALDDEVFSRKSAWLKEQEEKEQKRM